MNAEEEKAQALVWIRRDLNSLMDCIGSIDGHEKFSARQRLMDRFVQKVFTNLNTIERSDHED